MIFDLSSFVLHFVVKMCNRCCILSMGFSILLQKTYEVKVVFVFVNIITKHLLTLFTFTTSSIIHAPLV